MKLTHGGLPEDQAQHWTDANKKKLGNIVMMLQSTVDLRKKAYIDFYEMKRYFFVEEWDQFILILNTFRKDQGFGTMQELLDSQKSLILNPTQERGAQMDLKKIADGLRMIADGLEGGAQEPKEEKAKPTSTPKKETAPKVEKAAEPTVDFAAMRVECRQKVTPLVTKHGRDKVAGAIAEFKDAKGAACKKVGSGTEDGTIQDADLEELLEKFVALEKTDAALED
jgi:hypothetical protein